MKIVYDTTLMRPGCAILQAAYGADVSIARMFNSQDWLTNPTPDMGVYEVTKEQLELLIAKTEKARITS
jgi:hypothetical protein